MFEGKLFKGEKADIFSLGVVLFHLVTGKEGFSLALKKDVIYNRIRLKSYEIYWTLVDIYPINNENLSKEFKKLYFKMVGYNPDNRPSIDDILKDDWFNEINNLSEEEYNKINSDIYEEFKKIKNKIFPIDNEVMKYNKPENISPDEMKMLVKKAQNENVSIVIDNLQIGTEIGRTLSQDLKIKHAVISNFPLGNSYFSTLKDDISKIDKALQQ